MKRFIGMILAMIMVLALAACGETENTSETTGTKESAAIREVTVYPDNTSEEPAEEPSEEASEAPSEEPTESIEEISEEPSAEPTEEIGNEETSEPVESAALPSEDVVLSLADIIVPEWGADVAEYNTGQVYLNTNQAVEIAAIIAYWYPKLNPPYNADYDSYYIDETNASTGNTYEAVIYIIPASTMQTYMTKLFGSQYQLSAFTNSESSYAFETSIPGFVYSSGGYVSRNDDGDFEVEFFVGDSSLGGDNISVESITSTGSNTCVAVIKFDTADYGEFNRKSHTMSLGLVEDPSAEYGWAITSISFG